MKRLIFILFTFICISANSQTVNRFRDSTWFAKGVRFDSAIYLIKGASNGKVLTSDADGRATWQTFSGSGVSQSTLNDSITAVRSIRKVDTLYRNLDSLIFKINGIRYAIIDSSGGGSGNETLNEVLTNGNTTGGQNISISNGDAIILDNSSMLKKGTIDAGLGGSNGIAQICAVGYELKWEAGRLYVMGSNGNTIRQSLYNFTTTPTVNDDDLKGYGVGSLWTLDDNTTYVCLDATTANAVWELVMIGNQDLQSVTDEGNTTTNNIITVGGALVSILDTLYTCLAYIGTTDTIPQLYFQNINGGIATLQAKDITGIRIIQIPDTSGVLATSVNGVLADGFGNILLNYVDSDSLAQIRTEIADTANVLRGLIPNVSSYATITNLKDSTSTLRTLITSSVPTFSLSKSANRDSIVTVFNGTRTAVKDSSIVTPTFALSKNTTRDSIVTVFNGVRSAVRDSIGGGASTLALDNISNAVDTNTINNGNFQQEWRWNSLQNNSGLKLTSTSPGLLNTQNRLFEVQISGSMPGTGNSSYAGYFVNTQTLGSSIGLYAQGVNNSIQASGSINITSGSLQLGGTSGALFYRNSGNTFLQGASSEGMILQSNNGIASIYCGSNELGLLACRKTLNQRYVLGIGGSTYQSSAYLSANTTATLIEKDLGKLIFSANTGLAGGYASFTPNNVMTINGGATEATSNVGIGTISPVASAKLEISSTTLGFLPPRMTTTQINAIVSPAEGLVVYNTTLHELCFYDGTVWRKFSHSTM